MWKPDPKDNFALTKLLLKISGISLEVNENPKFKFYSAFVFLFTSLPFLQFLGVPSLLRTEKDVFEFVLFETLALIIIAKMIVLFYNRAPLAIILQKLQSGLLVPNVERGGTQEVILTNRYVGLTRKQNIIYWTASTMTTVFALTDSIIWRLTSKELSWRDEYGPFTVFNISYSPNFEIALFYQNINWMVLSTMFVVSELLIVAVWASLTCQFKILQCSIRRMVLNSYLRMMKDRGRDVEGFVEKGEIDASQIPWRYFQPTVAETVKYHLAIIEIAGEIERIFFVLNLLILLSAIALTGGFLYRFERVHIGGIVCHLCEVGMISYWGNEVSLESGKVMDACYDVNFLGADVRFQKSLFLIMERSKRPIVFTAGKFSPLNLGTFITIYRAAYSFLLILRRMT